MIRTEDECLRRILARISTAIFSNANQRGLPASKINKQYISLAKWHNAYFFLMTDSRVYQSCVRLFSLLKLWVHVSSVMFPDVLPSPSTVAWLLLSVICPNQFTLSYQVQPRENSTFWLPIFTTFWHKKS